MATLSENFCVGKGGAKYINTVYRGRVRRGNARKVSSRVINVAGKISLAKVFSSRRRRPVMRAPAAGS